MITKQGIGGIRSLIKSNNCLTNLYKISVVVNNVLEELIAEAIDEEQLKVILLDYFDPYYPEVKEVIKL